MHIKLDENIPVALARFLEKKGFSVSDVFSQGLSGADDHALALHCRQRALVLVTLDVDFANTALYPPRQHAGIVVLRPRGQGAAAVTSLFQRFLGRFELANLRQRTLIVEERLIRVR